MTRASFIGLLFVDALVPVLAYVLSCIALLVTQFATATAVDLSTSLISASGIYSSTVTIVLRGLSFFDQVALLATRHLATQDNLSCVALLPTLAQQIV